jgi:hypothetical protein
VVPVRESKVQSDSRFLRMGRGGLLEPVRWRWLPFERNLAVLAVMHGSDQKNLERVWNWKFGILRSLPRSTPSSRSTVDTVVTLDTVVTRRCRVRPLRSPREGPHPSAQHINLASQRSQGRYSRCGRTCGIGTFLIWFELGSATTFENLIGCVSGREGPESNERTNARSVV